MTVHRLKPLPVGPAIGNLIASSLVIERTMHALRQSYGPDGKHEGLVFWAGRRCGADAIAMMALVPRTDHGIGHVFVSEAGFGWAVKTARQHRLVLVAQVHSHPGRDTRHSDGDDDLVLLPSEGLYSLVVAAYGHSGLTRSEGVGIHQYQSHRWVQVSDSFPDPIIIVNAEALHA